MFAAAPDPTRTRMLPPVNRRAALLVALGALTALLAGCGPPPRPARLSDAEPERPRERAARERLANARCSTNWSLLYPGLGQICLRQDAEGGAIAALSTVEGAGLIYGAVKGQRGLTYVTAVGVQDLYVYGAFAPTLERQLAARQRFVPEETFGELLLAPFNGRVLAKPDVWGGILGMSLVGIATSALLLDRGRTYHPGTTPVIFGKDVPPGVAYPAAGLAFAGLFSHVAPAEETLFRGYVQSSLARACGEGCGWALGSFIFGLSHAPNALLLDNARDRERYLAIGVPFLVLAGQYLGFSYWRNGYSLAPPVAVHFWYDFIASAVDFALDPRHSPIAAKVSFAF
jgi:membrane protease YdiL (CAAX protease family)